MIYQKLRKVGNSYVVTIPMDEVEKMGLEEGDLLALNFGKAEMRPVLDDELQELMDESWADHEDGYRYLAGR